MTKLLTASALAIFFAIAPGWAQSGGSPRETSGSVNPQSSSGQRGPHHRVNVREENRATTALNLLVADGYTQWTDFRKAGKEYEARVVKSGREMWVRIDPDSRTIRPLT